MNVVVNNLLVNYNLSGKGKLVLLLHGWGDSATGMRNLAAELSKKYQVLVPDLPGFGSTQKPNGAWDLDDYANFIDSLLKKLDLKQPIVVIGHSNGGALAIRSIGLKKLSPQKLVLLAASGVRTNNPAKRWIFKIIAKTGNIATIWLPERYRQSLRKSLYGASGSDMLAVPELEETFKKSVRQDVQADAVVIDVPTLLIYAKNDEDIPIEDGRQYKDIIKNSRLEIIENAGHFVHQDQPDTVNKLILEFLDA